MKKKKESVFWTRFPKFLLLYILVILILAVLALSILRFITDSYELSQVDLPVKDFIAQFDHTETLYQLLSEKLSISGGSFETREEIIRKGYIPLIQEGEITYGKDYSKKQANDSFAWYDVYLGEQKIFALKLSKNPGDAGFFMDSWSLIETDVFQEGFGLEPADYQLIIPENASVSVNGKDAGYMVSGNDGVVLCAFEEEPLKANVVELQGLYLQPNIVVSLNGKRLEAGEGKDHLLYYLDTNESFLEYTVTVPYGVEVFLNEVPLTKASCFSYLSATYLGESSPYGMPETIAYTVKYLTHEPEVTGSYLGEEITPNKTEGGYYFCYPADTLYSLRVEAPQGAKVTVSGVALEESAATVAEMDSFNLSKYRSSMKEIPTSTVYTLDGLYLKPEVSVIYDGQLLKKTVDSSSTHNLLYTYLPPASDALKAEQEQFVEKFVRAFVKFVAEGPTNISSNFSNVTEKLVRKSGAYDVLMDIYAEMTWAKYFKSMEYNYLTTSDYVRLSEDCYHCQAAVSVDVTRFSSTKHHEIALNILVIHTNGEWKVAEFTYEYL